MQQRTKYPRAYGSNPSDSDDYCLGGFLLDPDDCAENDVTCNEDFWWDEEERYEL